MAASNKVYETTFIINASLDDPQIEAEIEKVKDLIVKSGGEMVEIIRWGRKRFAYPIKKRNNGFYVVMVFTAPRDIVSKLERFFHLDENILRFIAITLDKVAVKSRLTGEHLLKTAVTPTTTPTDPAAPTVAPATAPAVALAVAPVTSAAPAAVEKS
jgi:small subunit ribosomal protein S6